MAEADENQSGFISYWEFILWPGKNAVMEWIDAYESSILTRFSRSSGSPRSVSVPKARSLSPRSRLPDYRAPTTAISPQGLYPWDGISSKELVRVFRTKAWGGSLILSEFERVLDKLGLDGRTLGKRLFDAFDRDGNRQLDFREMFIGMSLLLSGSREERLESAFMMMDSNGSGRVSQDELQPFLQNIAPSYVAKHEIADLSTQIMREADTNRSGLIDFREFLRWPGKHAVLTWIDQYQSSCLLRYDSLSSPVTPLSVSSNVMTLGYTNSLSAARITERSPIATPTLGTSTIVAPSRTRGDAAHAVSTAGAFSASLQGGLCQLQGKMLASQAELERASAELEELLR